MFVNKFQCIFLLQQAEGKLTGRHANVDDDEIVTTKRRKGATRAVIPVAVPSRFRAADTSNVKQVRHGVLFRGYHCEKKK